MAKLTLLHYFCGSLKERRAERDGASLLLLLRSLTLEAATVQFIISAGGRSQGGKRQGMLGQLADTGRAMIVTKVLLLVKSGNM